MAALRCGAKRPYATQRPPLSHGGSNKPIIIGLVALTVPATYMAYQRTEVAYSTPFPDDPAKIPTPPQLDPVARFRNAKEANANGRKHLHPEHLEPEVYKPAFGRVHQRKRVDGPPDGRNHKDLNDRNKWI
ncbi:uncharacterized protein BCR38DRAFT_486799 [Pseudomassariella vexata]|uniref:Uncharacterized protein n=1 Tax=Pseudomassariella vexata TaxID=1141098 RepID=A0A1Y2DTM9_9PEZI|nr:uncharacterized protein BCR38DRAFT_486799 [Pseudomassariella vexata]ORY62529.1 hypothetical protein BCR38DRAFT_486799 [Pseudomassariella vexata]